MEIIDDRRAPNVVHCVIQQAGTPEILLLEQFYSREQAEAAAEEFIASYPKQHRGRAAA